MAVNRTSTRVLASTFSPGGAKWKSMLTKSCGWYDLIVPQRCSVPFGPISTIWPPGFASTRIALAGAPPMADTLNLPCGLQHPEVLRDRGSTNRLAFRQLAHGFGLFAQRFEDAAAGGVGEGGEHCSVSHYLR